MLIAVAGVLLGTLGLSDAQRIARFEEFQRQLGIQNHGVELVAGGNVAAALHQFVLCVHCLGGSLGVFANHVLEHDHIAGLANGVVRLRSDDQSERLKIRGDIQFAAMVVADQHFAEVHGAAFGRDCPEDVGQILVAESRGLLQIAKFRFDFDVALLAFTLAWPLAAGIRSVPAKSTLEAPLRCL